MPSTFVLSVLAGVAGPAQPGTASAPDLHADLVAGWRTGHTAFVQPEVLIRATAGAPVVNVAPGVALGLGDRVSGGVYGHVGMGVVGYPFPGLDAGVWAEVAPVPWLRPSIRAGWEWDHPTRYKCGTCAQPSDHWLSVVGGVTFRL